MDATVNGRSAAKEGENRVSDRVAESVLECLEQPLGKCQLGSVDQMVVIMKKLTYAAMVSPPQASEEFREGLIKCLRAMLLWLCPCSDSSCSRKQISGLPELSEKRNLQPSLSKASESEGCLVAFLRRDASTAVGQWLSLLLEANGCRYRGCTLSSRKWQTSSVGSADALAFFLRGVVS